MVKDRGMILNRGLKGCDSTMDCNNGKEPSTGNEEKDKAIDASENRGDNINDTSDTKQE